MKGTRFFRARLFGALLLTLASAPQVLGQVSGLSYTVTPGVDRPFPADGMGLKPSFLPGMRVGFGFGTFVELQGVYQVGRGIDSDPGTLMTVAPALGAGLDGITPRSVDLTRYGAELKLNFSRTRVVPFVTGSTGILRLDPDGLERSEMIYLEAGAGLQVRLADRLALVLRGNAHWHNRQPAAFLLSGDDLAAAGLAASDVREGSVRQLSAGAGLKVTLGGRAEGAMSDLDRELQQQLRGGLKGLALVVEPAYAVVRFASESGYRRTQRFATVAAGLDLGPYVGVRGFYWRGIEPSGTLSLDDLQAYGAEMKFNLSGDVSGLRPYLTLGAGRMDVRPGYLPAAAPPPSDQTFAMGGAGVQLPISRTILLFASARRLLMASQGVDSVTDPSSLHPSTMYAAGVSLGIGGGKSPAERLREAGRLESARRDADFEAYRVEQARALAQAQARIDSLTLRLAQPAVGDAASAPLDGAVHAVPADTALAVTAGGAPSADSLQALPAATAERPTSAEGHGARWMSIPVPEEGEIYIRFGKSDTTFMTRQSAAPEGVATIREATAGIPATAAAAVASSATAAPPVAPTAPAIAPPGALPAAADRAALRELLRETLLEMNHEGDQTGAGATSGDSAALRALEARAAETARQVERLESQVREEREARESAERARREAEERASRMERDLERTARPERAAMPTQQATESLPTGDRAGRPTWAPDADTTETRAPGADSTGIPLIGHGNLAFVAVHPTVGFLVDSPRDFLFGARGEFRQNHGRLMLLPSVLLGVGSETALFVDAHFAFDLKAIPTGDRGFYAGAGLGLTSVGSTALTVNLLAGYRRVFKPGSFFGEIVTAGPFSRTRLQAGYRILF